MTQPGTFRLALTALVLAALLPLTASAQGMGGRPPGGNGIKVGNGRLHPTLDLETRLDSGVGYFLDQGTGPLSPDLSGELALHVRPGLMLDVPSQKLALSLRGNLDYVVYTGLLTPGSSAATHLEGMADLALRFDPEGTLSVEVGDQLTRSDRTRTVALGAGILSLYNEARVRAQWKPGGGALELTPSVAYAMEFFEPLGGLPAVGCTEAECDPLAASQFNYGNLRLGVEGRWRFLPKTAVVADTGLTYRGYFNDTTTPSATLVHVMAGVAGLVSPRITLTAKAGWSQNLGAGGGGNVVALAEGTYLWGPTLTLKGGYLRAFEPVAAYGTFRDDRIFAEARSLMGSRLALHAAGAVDFIAFTGERNDTLVSLDLGPEYQFRPWLVGAVGYTLSSRSSSLSASGFNYTRNEGYARLSVTY
ncbi:hypothetical protein D7Y13_41105 [Corallococcus praedator]|uniref:Uncharacterized protein n=2 Tax=Myxococcaceae TaxID=31 RepID=A0ABX9Q3M8_9BACT|nr:hypothetical protein [Corallococcus sp. CA047B]RKG96302.1 hypothetical protein D7X74_41525 [Corallococcus sp. CA047B]RKH16321.1 hypothetical protein D7X75_40960 [Corallococcus sp. CA031C]RKH88936.1 hypothetical protein D7Y13_41105 [Corallococcus praedator]